MSEIVTDHEWAVGAGQEDEIVVEAMEGFGERYQREFGSDWEKFAASLISSGRFVHEPTQTGMLIMAASDKHSVSKTDALVALAPLSRGLSPMAAGHGDMIRRVAKVAGVRGEDGLEVPVIMMGAPVGGPDPLGPRLDRQARREVANGDLTPYLRPQLEALRDAPGLERTRHLTVIGHSLGASAVSKFTAMAAAQNSNKEAYEVLAQGIGSPVAVKRRALPVLLAAFGWAGRTFEDDVAKYNHKYFAEAAAVEAHPLAVGRRLLGARAMNMALWAAMGHETLAHDLVGAYVGPGQEKTSTIVAATEDGLAPWNSVLEQTSKAIGIIGQHGPELVTTIKLEGAKHSWGDTPDFYRLALATLAAGYKLAA